MRAPWRRAAALTLAAGTFGFLPLLNGCKSDVERADESVSADLASATDTLQRGGTDATESAQRVLQKSVANKAAGPESTIQSNSLLAQAEIDAADALARTVDSREAQVGGVIARMYDLGSQIELNNLNVAGYRSLDPAKTADALKQMSTAAEQGDNGQWVKGNPPIPALSDARQRQESLQKQIDDLTHQRDDLSKKRADALQGAERLSRQSDSTTGKDSQGFFIQASNQRKDAADDQARIEAIDGQLVPLRQQMAVAQEQQKQIEAALASMKQDAEQLQAGWQGVQKQIETANAFSASLLNGSGSSAAASASPAPSDAAAGATTQPAADQQTPRSLSALAGQLDQLAQQNDADRDKAIELLDGAHKHLDAAIAAAQKLQTDLTKRSSAPDARKLPEYHAWQDLLDVNHPTAFKVRQAAVQQRLGRLLADHWAELNIRNRTSAWLAGVLKAAGLQPPASSASLNAPAAVPAEVQAQLDKLNADIAKPDFGDFGGAQTSLVDLAKAQKDVPAAQQAVDATRANLAYAYSDALAGDVFNSAGNGASAPLTQNLGHLVKMGSDYGWAVFARAQGKTPEFDAHLKNAIEERKALTEANAVALLPTQLPPGLEVTTASTQPAQPSATGTSATGTPSGSTEQPAVFDTGDAADVRRAATQFFAAMVSNDANGVQSMLSSNDPQFVQFATQTAEMVSTISNYKNAVLSKFGDQGNVLVAAIPDIIPDVTSTKIDVNGNNAKLSNPKDPDVLDLVKVNGTWKIAPPPGMQQEMAQIEPVKRLVAVFKAATPDITAGKYATARDLANALLPQLQAAGFPVPPGIAPETQPATQPTTAPAQ